MLFGVVLLGLWRHVWVHVEVLWWVHMGIGRVMLRKRVHHVLLWGPHKTWVEGIVGWVYAAKGRTRLEGVGGLVVA